MRRIAILLILLCASVGMRSAEPAGNLDWRAHVDQEMASFGHRNWILIVDSAYPRQVAPGIEVVETDAGLIEVAQHVLHAMDRSIHVRPHVYMDAELPFVSDADAPGASAYRQDIASILRGIPVESLPHDKLIAQVGEAGQQFHVLVLKTNLAVPYSSLFIRLDCKYWSDDAEARLRSAMHAAGAGSAQ